MSVSWLLGVSLFGVLLLVGLWRTVQMRRTSLTVSDGEWPGMLVELRQRLGLARSVELREHASSVVPLTWGIWRPVVLLPKLARAWNEPMRRAVLLHELAHVQRGDVACQVLGRLTCVLYWFHPLAWFALRQLRQEREQACDDAVVQTGEKASDYAAQLLEVARLCCAPRGLSLGVAMAEGSSLERRVKSLFDSARSHGPLTRRVALTLFVIGGAILAGLAPIEPTASQAEPVKSDAVPLKDTPNAGPKSVSSDTNSKVPQSEYPFALKLCRKAFSDPATLQQLEQLKPVYGKAKRGIQLGLAINTLSRSFAEGEQLPLMLVYRNVGHEELTFHISQDHWNDPPTVIDQNGHHVQVSFVMHWMFVAPLKITLNPGEAWCEMTPGLYLGEPMPSIKPVAGKYRLTHPQGISDWQYEQRLETKGSAAGQIVNSPTWFEQLDTGRIEFEIALNNAGALEARVLASLPAASVDASENPNSAEVSDSPEKETTPLGQTEAAPKDGAEVPLDQAVWWGERVEGLEPGFWLTKSEDPRNLRIPMDSLVKYRVVVRNTTDEEREFLVRLLPFDGLDVPYLIPSDKLDPKGRITPPQPAKEFQARGAENVLKGINPAYVITLAAGESALVPGEYGLYVGKAPDERYPQIANFVPGTHWLIQPLLVHPLADTESAELNRLLGEFQITKFDRSGKSRQEPVVRVGAPDDSNRKFAYAKYHLAVGTLDASADRNAEKAIWGKVEKGLQCGIRMLNPQPSYKVGDTLEAEVLWRNTSEAVISPPLPRRLDLYPIIEDAEGKQPQIDFGARYDLRPGGHDFQPGEVRSLGVTQVTLVAPGTPGPKDNKEPGHITLEPGNYKFSASGGVGNINPRSGKIEFTVLSSESEEKGLKPAVPPIPAEDTTAKDAEPMDAKPAFTEFVVNIQPFEAPRNGYMEQLKFEAKGKCWYKVEGREAAPNLPARNGAVFNHTLSPERIRNLNQLLGDTQWLLDDEADDRPPPLHATTYQLTLKREGQERSIVIKGERTDPLKALLHFLEGIAAQERRIYRHDYLSGKEGSDAWQEIGRELAALRGEPYGKSPYEIDYARYLPIAIRNVRDFHGKPDEELITSVRLIGHLQVKSELEFVHRMAQDRSGTLRQEVAWTLGRIHDPKSLPVLFEMMSGAGTRWEIGFELIRWGDDAVPGIVKLIELSTKEGLAERERVTGEDMIRAYLQHWDQVSQSIPADVVATVKQALEAKNPLNGGIRTTYHKEFLKKVAELPAVTVPQVRPNGPVASQPVVPKPVTPQPVDNTAVDTKRDLLQRLARGGKISTDSLNAMITLVSSEGAFDREFIAVVLTEFDKSCEPNARSSKRNLLEVLTKMLEIHGSSRWQALESGPESLPQAVIPDAKELSQLSSQILNHVIAQGRKADRSNIDAFVLALRQAHHADGMEFLRDVLRNPEVNVDPFQAPAVQAGKWSDNMGGTWWDAKFHAAVSLAELQEPEGVEWLIEHARPNDFGLGASLFHLQHSRDAVGFTQVSCRQSLIDLFGLKHDAEFAALQAWWKANAGQFHPRRVALGRVTQPPAAELPQPEQKPAPPGPRPPQPVGEFAPTLPDVRWEGDEVTPEQIDTLAGKQWGTVTLIKDKYNGELIERLRHATSIRCLRLFGDDLGGQTGRLKQIAGLVELEIGTPLKSRELQAIGEMTQLTALSLPQEMTMNVLGAREIARLKNLRSLRLYYVDIDDTAFAELAPLTQLEEIDLTHTRITDSGLSVLSKMPQLRSLELYRFPNWHTSQQLTDACLPVVCQLQKLERLSLSGEISDEGLKQVARLPKLKSLMLLGANITGEGLAALEHSTVESLLLSPQQVGTTGLENLKKCKSLKHILVTGRFDGLEEIEQWQTALPGVDWSFNDP